MLSEMPDTETKGGFARKLLAILLAAIAARLAMIAVEFFWTKGLRRDLPEMSETESALTKAAWVGLTAAAVGIARELAKSAARPRVKEEAAKA
jgi:hypothetical protein